MTTPTPDPIQQAASQVMQWCVDAASHHHGYGSIATSVNHELAAAYERLCEVVGRAATDAPPVASTPDTPRVSTHVDNPDSGQDGIDTADTRDELVHDLVDWWHSYGIGGGRWEPTGEPLPEDLGVAAAAFIDHACTRLSIIRRAARRRFR